MPHYGGNPRLPVKPPITREAEVDTAYTDDGFAKVLDRIATALESIDFTLKQISKKLK